LKALLQACASVLLLLGVVSGFAEDWPRFLGPNGDGTSSETGLIDRFPEGGPPLVWEKDIGSGYSAPSVRGGKLVLHHRIKAEEIVQAFALPKGEPIWRYAYPTSFIDPYGYNNGPRSTPLLTSNRVYTFGAEGKLLCLDLSSGKLVWQRDTQKDWNIPEAFFGVGSTPLLEDGRLIVMIGGQPNSGVAALDPETGKTLWESVGELNWRGQPMHGWPGERTVDLETVHLGQTSELFVARSRDGEWRAPCFLPDAPGARGVESHQRRGEV
jgi:hypothetical protein